MKYIKLFENKNRPLFWKIRIRNNPNRVLPRLEVVFDKIGMNEEDIKYWIEMIKFYKNEYIYIYFYPNRFNEKWKWSNCTKEMYDKNIENFEYMGEVKITKEDIEIYRLKKIANKYNL